MFPRGRGFYGLATIVRVLMARRVGHEVRPSTADPFNLASLKQSLAQMASLVLAGGVVTWIFISDGVFDVAMSISTGLVTSLPSQYHRFEQLEISSFSSVFHATMMMIASH